MQGVRFRLRVFLFLTVLVLVSGTLGFMVLEGLSLVDALYFSVVTVTTVGYGDISPSGGLGKILAVVVILGGIAAFSGVVANATEMLLSRHERAVRQQKLHMVRGVFFSEIGSRLLHLLTAADPMRNTLFGDLAISYDWDHERFSTIKNHMSRYEYKVDPGLLEMEVLLDLLDFKGDFLLRLLENQSLMEEEGLTETLRAVFHLRDELEHRRGNMSLPANDIIHICGDAKRAYRHLTSQWIDYVEYLQVHFPYLFSLAVRTNPFAKSPSAIIEES